MHYLYIGMMGLLFCFMAVKTLSTYFWESPSKQDNQSSVITHAGDTAVPDTVAATSPDIYKTTAPSSNFTESARRSERKPQATVMKNASQSSLSEGMSSGGDYAPEVAKLVEKVKSLNSYQIQAEIEKIVTGESVPKALREQALLAVSKEWSKEDPQAVLDYLSDNPLQPASLRYEAEQEVLKELARTDPAAAVDILADMDESGDAYRKPFMKDYFSSIATGWAQSDPEEAFSWLNQQDFEDGTKAFNKYINELTKIDEDLAFDQINRLTPEKQAEAIKGISSEWGKEAAEAANWEAVQSRIDSLLSDIQDEALRNALIPYSQENPQDAMDIISAIPENNTEKNRIVYQVLDQLGQDNHREKIEWAVQNSTDDYTSHVAGTVLRPWMQQDAHGAMQWLSEQQVSTSNTQLAKLFLNDKSAPSNYKQVIREKFNIPE